MAGENDDDVVVHIPNEGDDGTVIVEKGKEGDDGAQQLQSANFNEDPLEDLKGQFATMTQRATAAETAAQNAIQRANEAEQRAHRVENEMVTSQLDTVVSGIAAAEAEAAAAEAAYVAAVEAGDAAAMARAHRAISRAEANKVRLEEAKSDLEDEAKARKDRPAPTHRQPSQPQQTGDVVERFVQSLSPKSAAWVRAHPECVTDQRKNRLMLAADNIARANGIEVESPEYFALVEEYVNGKQAKPEQQQRRTNGDGTRPSSAAASGGSDRGGQLRGGQREVRLTKGEAQSATDGTLVWNYDDPTGKGRYKKGDPIGLAEMARRKAEGQKRGLYDRNSIEA